jgi:hypothetical protein
LIAKTPFNPSNYHRKSYFTEKISQARNAFWEKLGFTVREDLIYRNKAIAEIVRIDT